MTTEQPIITNYDGDSETFTPIAYECKFTVEGTGNAGGDFESNIGGAHEQKRVTFEGYATNELYAAVIDAIRRTVGAEVDA